MKKIAVFLAEGFEEGETAAIVDVLRRASFQCDMVSLKGMQVTGAHGIAFTADTTVDDLAETLKAYDMIVLPGGWTGVDNLEASDAVLDAVRYFNGHPEKYVAAMCAAPSVLAKAGVTKGRKLTSYPGPKLEPLFTDAVYLQDAVVVDGTLITSRAPATALPFAFALVDILGGDSAFIKGRFMYDLLKEYQDGLTDCKGSAS